MAHFGPTRSGTGDAHASGQALPLIRTLLDTLVCEPQARLRTFPGNDILGTRGEGICWIKVGGQERRIQITLHRANSARALVPALRKRLFERLAAPVTELTEFGCAGSNFNQGAARACNGASQQLNEHPWSAKSYTFAVLFLPRLVGEFLDNDGVAYRHELMDLLPMQALAMSRQLAFLAGLPASGFLVGLAAFPVQLLLASLLDAPPLVVVVGIGGAPLSLHLALEPADVLLIRGQRFAEDLQARFGLLGDQRDGRRSQVGPDRVASDGVFGLVIRHAFQRQLDEVAKALSIGPLRLGAAGFALDQTRIFDAVIESVFHHRVVPVDEHSKLVVFPDEKALLALLWLVQHETQPSVVAFVLDAGKAPPSALEAHATGLSHTDAIERLVGARGERLSQHRIQVLGNPGHPRLPGILVQGIFREAVLLPQRRKGYLPLLLVSPGDGAGHLPCRIGSHLAQTALSFGKHGIVEGAPRFQMAADAFGLASVNLQGQFKQERGRLATRLFF